MHGRFVDERVEIRSDVDAILGEAQFRRKTVSVELLQKIDSKYHVGWHIAVFGKNEHGEFELELLLATLPTRRR